MSGATIFLKKNMKYSVLFVAILFFLSEACTKTQKDILNPEGKNFFKHPLKQGAF